MPTADAFYLTHSNSRKIVRSFNAKVASYVVFLGFSRVLTHGFSIKRCVLKLWRRCFCENMQQLLFFDDLGFRMDFINSGKRHSLGQGNLKIKDRAKLNHLINVELRAIFSLLKPRSFRSLYFGNWLK